MEEKVILNQGNAVVSTERFIAPDGKGYPLNDVDKPFVHVDRQWMTLVAFAVIPLGMVILGGTVWKAIGILGLVGAYFLHRKMMDFEVWIFWKDKSIDVERIKFRDAVLARQFAAAILQAITARDVPQEVGQS